jgi:hypothetical protein
VLRSWLALHLEGLCHIVHSRRALFGLGSLEPGSAESSIHEGARDAMSLRTGEIIEEFVMTDATTEVALVTAWL